MKRFLILTITVLSIVLLSLQPSLAAETFELIPVGANWVKTDHGGASVTLEETDGIFVFSGSFSGTWPCTETWYTDVPIVAAVDSYSLVFDFIVEGGATNINFFFDDGNGGSVGYTICNTALDPVNYDTGSGDLKDGTYRGAVKLSDFVNAKKLLDNTEFPASAIHDGEIRFIGVQIYSVNGAKITVSTMDIVHNDDVASVLPSDPPAEDESSQESTVSEESETVDSDEESSQQESSAPTESTPVQSEDDQKDVSAQDGRDDEDSTSVLVTIIAVAGILICVAIAVFFLRRKHSRQ